MKTLIVLLLLISSSCHSAKIDISNSAESTVAVSVDDNKESVKETKDKQTTTSSVKVWDCEKMMAMIHGKYESVISASEELPIPNEHRIIIDLNKNPDPIFKGSYFLPKREEVEAANRAVVVYLSKAPKNSKVREYDKKKIPNIIGKLEHYYVQYIGEVSKGKRLIRCNFFFVVPPNDCPDNREDPHASWREEVVSVRGGGEHYWTAIYDINKDIIETFWINAER